MHSNPVLHSPRIIPLPDRPQRPPLQWQQQAQAFDRFVMDFANGVAYRDEQGRVAFTAFLEGEHYGTLRHELVTFGPLALGKWLNGDDITALLPTLESYFLQPFGIFSNGPADERCEMWYLMYANALAGHLIRRHTHRFPHWRQLWQQSADALRDLAQRIGYDFNHQGYDFAAQAPWTARDIFRQPDAIGGYAYLMLLTHRLLGGEEYLDEARRALRRYLALAANPWYEAPDGALATLAAAYLAAQGESFDTAKALDWLLDPDAALALGEWGGQEVNGLARGWRFSERDSVYSMESLMILPFILPVARYAPQLASEIGRYALHVAANARLFYSEYMAGCESRPDLTPAVAYERLLARQGDCAPFATGDFQGHKSVYGGAYALWWGALVKPTRDPYVLQLDLAATDFLADSPDPAYLYYNPWPEARSVEVALGAGPHTVVELGSGQTLVQDKEGQATIELPPGAAYVLRVRPSAS
jgi:hypothetical protein